MQAVRSNIKLWGTVCISMTFDVLGELAEHRFVATRPSTELKKWMRFISLDRIEPFASLGFVKVRVGEGKHA
ncbi:MAG: hypothetical protein O9296_14105 [Novosphingobium sp.]|nr:hypothetical protein [Burkholderiales bacterium]MCZ8322696.1 hypothetical protein [Novosphingobium sp.]